MLADEEADIFDGLVIDRAMGTASPTPPRWQGFFENGVELTLTYEEAEQLPEPSENPAAMGADPDDVTESELTRKLRSAWDRISGRY